MHLFSVGMMLSNSSIKQLINKLEGKHHRLVTRSHKSAVLFPSVLDGLAPLCVFPVRLVVRKKAAVKRCEEQLLKLEVQATDREENKQIALGTSKLNYLDPRISVAW